MEYMFMLRVQISKAFGARKGCTLEEYKRPRTVPEDEFSGFVEALRDITVQIPGLVEMPDQSLHFHEDDDSQKTYTHICNRWQDISYHLKDWVGKMTTTTVHCMKKTFGLHRTPNWNLVLLTYFPRTGSHKPSCIIGQVEY